MIGNSGVSIERGVCPSMVCCRCREYAFTLIEMLICMAILTVMVLLALNILSDMMSLWERGMRRTEVDTIGRAAVEVISRELTQAIAGPIEASDYAGGNLTFQVEGPSDLRFLSLANAPVIGQRAIQAVLINSLIIDANTGELKIQIKHMPSPDCYSASPTWSGNFPDPDTLVENVRSLFFYVYESEADLGGTSGYVSSYPSTLTDLPYCVDIAVEVLSARDWERASSDSLSGSDKTDYMNRCARVYTTRVYCPNRTGYQRR